MAKLPFIHRPPTPHPRMEAGHFPFRSHDPSGEADERAPLLRNHSVDRANWRPVLGRHWSYPFRDTLEPPKTTWQQSLGERAAHEVDELRERVQEAEDRAEAGFLRLLMRAAWHKIRHKRICC